MKYVITDGDNYLKKDEYNNQFLTKFKSEAIKFKDVISASKELTSMKNELKKGKEMYIMPFDKIDAFEDGVGNYNINTSNRFKGEIIDKKYTITQILDIIKEIYDYMSKRERYVTYLYNIENKKCFDIDHAIEFGTFNGSQGCKLAVKFREARNNRRKYKNELNGFKILKKYKLIEFSKMEDEINSLKNQKYIPRYLTELFNESYIHNKVINEEEL